MRPAWAPLLAAGALAASPALAAPPAAGGAPRTVPHVEVALAPVRATVGDRVEAVLTLRAPAPLTGEPRFPAWRGSWGDAEVLEVGTPEKTAAPDGAAIYRQRLVLAAFRPGAIALPPVEVAVPFDERTVRARTPDGLALTISSVLPPPARDGKDPLPKPPAPPRGLPLGERFWWTAAGMSAACLAAGLLLARRRWAAAAGTGRDPSLPPLPPIAELLAGLDRLSGEGSSALLHTRLSLALRRYLGRTLSFPAPESTTSEIHRRLAARHLPPALARRAVDLLRGCDLVKFARQEVSAGRGRERLAAARELGGELEAYLNPPAVPETARPAAGRSAPRGWPRAAG